MISLRGLAPTVCILIGLAACSNDGTGPSAPVKPKVGDADSFYVCANTSCDPSNANNFVRTYAHAKYVGQRVAIYVDDGAPTDGYTQTDLNQVGALFDDYLYPIDTTAFGRESDIDNNGVVIVLLTQHVNALSPNCKSNGSIILGYFYGLDLSPTNALSNKGEVFYGLVPDPTSEATSNCSVSTTDANRSLPPTFIHEFQHMISYNHHVLQKASGQENVWLNEGLSHFAEELGGWKVPDSRCYNNDCLSQFAADNLVNAYNYLMNPEATYLVAPSQSTGTLEERGAGWLFVRWVADHFGSDQYGTNVTRLLDNTNQVGAANIESVTSQSFSTLVPLWQMANYLDNLSGFTPSSPYLQYEIWDLRYVFSHFYSDPNNHGDFPRVYPLVPDSVTDPYSRSNVQLLAGSGVHLLVTQPASGSAVDVSLTATDLTTPSTCTSANQVSLAVGAYTIINPAAPQGSCVRVPAAGVVGAQYLYVAVATNGVQTSTGVEGTYGITSGTSGAMMMDVAGLLRPSQSVASVRASTVTPASAFHYHLRMEEAALAPPGPSLSVSGSSTAEPRIGLVRIR